MRNSKFNSPETRAKAQEARLAHGQSYEKFIDGIHCRNKSYFKGVPRPYQKLFMEIYLGKITNKTLAVKAKCLDCCCFDRKEIAECPAQTCPLWQFRYWKSGDITDSTPDDEDSDDTPTP
jgi:hypothetical protein